MITVIILSDIGDDINAEVEYQKKKYLKIITITMDTLLQLKEKMGKSILLGRQIILK